jgi:MFS family permease
VRSGLGERIADAVSACSVNLRSRNLRRAQAAFGCAWAGDWAATVGIGVIAFDRGGAAAVGLVGMARMVPAAVVAPLAATIADRARRELVLVWVGLVRAVSLGGAAVLVATDGSIALVYVAIVVATVAQTLFRPAHSALLPTLCATPAELTSANVVRGLLDSVATLIGPVTAAVLLKVSGPAAVLLAAATASALAASLAVKLRYESPPLLVAGRARAGVAQAVEGIRAIATDRTLTLLTALATLQTFTRGALTVFSVVVAINLLGGSSAGVGVLVAAVGAGGIVGSLLAVLLVGRGGLARWFGAGVALWGAPLALISVLPHWGSVIPLLAVVGIGNALVDVGVFTLIARLADDIVLARVFAAFEGIITLGVAAGAIVAPVLIGALGIRGALVVCGAIAPSGALASWRALRLLDDRVRVRDADVALLQLIPMLQPLPETTIEQLAARLGRAQLPAGVSVFKQGDVGDVFYVIEQGAAEVVRDGHTISILHAGEGFGEIALIRDCHRTATVLARTSLLVRTLNRTVFVAAVAGYTASAQAADHVISGHLRHVSMTASPEPSELSADASAG